MPQTIADEKELPLDVVGSSSYGRSSKISTCRTYNMIISDGWLVDYSGYKNRLILSEVNSGRGIYGSALSDTNIIVVGSVVYLVKILYDPFNPEESIFQKSQIGLLDTFYGDVFIDENNTGQIGICDQKDLFIYTISTNNYQKVIFPDSFVPCYITYQDGYFIAPNKIGNDWAISAPGDGLSWNWGPSGEMVSGRFQTKPDNPVAVVRAPGKGGLVYVMGKTVTELWSNQPTPQNFPYIRNSSNNIDYGCVSSATIAVSENVIAWLGQNENSGPVIMFSSGSEVSQVSTDGINYKFSQLNSPESSSAFFVKLSGHLLYQLTFYDPQDNFSILYDFQTGKIFDVSDENQNHHIARHVNYFNSRYYFVSFNDGNMYELNDHMFTYDYGIGNDLTNLIKEIPRIRICSNIRTPDQDQFIAYNLTFTLEQGTDYYNTGNDSAYNPRIALSLSKDGGFTFSNFVTKPVYKLGNRKSKLNWWNLGFANDLVPQIRFYGKGPFRATDGVINVYV